MALQPSEVSAVLVTRGDVSMDRILESLVTAGIKDVVLWDNSKRPVDLSCYGRYAGINEAKHEFIFHQDDDLLVPVPRLLEAYDPVADCRTIVANNRAGEEWRLTAMGAVFHRSLAECFDSYIDVYGFDADFLRVSDVVFAYQHDYRRVVLGYEDLPNASLVGSSMYLEEGHMHVRIRARQRVLELPLVAAPA